MTQARDRADYSALSDRITYLLGLRLAFAAIVVIGVAARPEVLGAPLSMLAAGSAAYVLASVLGEWARRRASVHGFALLSALLLLDGLYLAAAMYSTGGTQSPMRFLIYLHLVAVSLLASYRTGLKVALWHSLLLFVGLYAQAAQLVPAVDVLPGRAIEFDRMPVLYLTSFWLFALATSVFSAINERELRNRRTDLQALVDIGARLDDATDPVHQSQTVLDGLGDRFGFTRGLIVAASEGQMIVLASRGAVTVPTVAVQPDAIIEKAWDRRELLAIRRLDGANNPVLSAALPGAGNLLISPMIADGRPLGAIVVEHRSRSLAGVERRVASVLGQLSAIAALNLRQAALLRHVQDLAERDPLTGAANRRTFHLTLERLLASKRGPAATSGNEGTAVLFIDLDDFKIVNDAFGHAEGDALLVAVTDRIRGSVREGDLVARLGGDEFAILTEDDPDLKRSLVMAERLTHDLRAPFVLGENHVNVTASIGIAMARDSSESASDVIRNADVAMYIAKANGKAGFAVFDPGMHAMIRERHELGAQLQRAVELDQMRLVYQPIVALDSGRLAGVEALARWQHPELGLIQPGDFIDIAEDNGAILQIGRWVLREACRMAGDWGPDHRSMFLCVNVSAREIQQPRFVEAVQEALTGAALEPERLHLEITETALLKATPSTIATLESLRRLGVRVVIDDFGTGYFSLSHLRQFPVDMLKVASEFVQVPDTDTKSAAIAGAILAMSQSLEIRTVAEGIETAEQAARMRALGCTYGQGYFFAKPQTDAEIDVGAFGPAGDGDDLALEPTTRVRTGHGPTAIRPRWIRGTPPGPGGTLRPRPVIDSSLV
ncbi:MAG: EAL domain-containing protein [Candidatus Limnocylindrales bacterium]|nr:EAL domain-containing protein [Candidatus Limnocylindrales bacterium]